MHCFLLRGIVWGSITREKHWELRKTEDIWKYSGCAQATLEAWTDRASARGHLRGPENTNSVFPSLAFSLLWCFSLHKNDHTISKMTISTGRKYSEFRIWDTECLHKKIQESLMFCIVWFPNSLSAQQMLGQTQWGTVTPSAASESIRQFQRVFCIFTELYLK